MYSISKISLATLASFCICQSVAIAQATNKTNNEKNTHAYSLLDTYNLAYKNNGTFQADIATFKSQEENVPIALGALLPSITATYNYTENHSDPAVFTSTENYTSYGPELTISQLLFDWSTWKTYTSAQYTLKANAITLAQAQQTLIVDTVSDYFAVLNNQELLAYAVSSQEWNKNLYNQSQQKYEVGTIPISDVQSSKATYEQSNALTIQYQNDLLSSIYTLKQLTGINIEKLDSLKDNFPFELPKPNNVNTWLNIALKDNLSIVQNKFLLQAAKENVSLAWGAYYPSLAAEGSLSKTTSFQGTESLQPTVGSIGLSASWTPISGGANYANLKQQEYLSDFSRYTLDQSRLTTESSLKQAYLSVESDIAIINAYKQSVIAGEYAVKTMKAQYDVGTSTIVDLLNQQQLLVESQQELSNAKFQYINDLIALKQQAGTLSIEDIKKINAWLKNNQQSTKNKTSSPKMKISKNTIQ